MDKKNLFVFKENKYWMPYAKYLLKFINGGGVLAVFIP
jgi:hypothetical protein